MSTSNETGVVTENNTASSMQCENDVVFSETSSIFEESNGDLQFSGIVTIEMLEEDRRLAEENRRQEEEMKRELEGKYEKELTEQRQKRLMHLLSKSKVYSKILAMKLKKSELRKEELERKEKESKKRASAILRENNNGLVSPKKSNKQRIESSDKVAKPSKRKREENYNIGDIIDSETITAIKYMKKDDEPEVESPLAPLETRITSFGIEVSTEQPELLEGGVLRNYQLDGVKWAHNLCMNGMNGILADEMGLGKTIQVIGLICKVIEEHQTGPFLIIAPLSTLANWMIEFSRFAPKLKTVLYHGPIEVRKALQLKVMIKKQVGNYWSRAVVLTSYEIPLRDQWLKQHKWFYLVVDEAHRVKSYKSCLTRVLKTYNACHRLLLTGTPLQNNLVELWSLLNFILPDIFNTLDDFAQLIDVEMIQRQSVTKRFEGLEDHPKMLNTLHEILSPFLLRRMKSEVCINLPPKKEILVYAPMTSTQIDLYKLTVNRNIKLLSDGKRADDNAELIIPDELDGTRKKRKSTMKKVEYRFNAEWYHTETKRLEEECAANVPEMVESGGSAEPVFKSTLTMQSVQVQLRKIVNHPYLVHCPTIDNGSRILVDEDIIAKSGKMQVLDAMLAKLKSRGHRVLIFSTFVMVIDMIEEFCIMRGHTYERLDGKVRKIEDRQQSIHRFNTTTESFLFLISTRAGGLGINLTAADTVIIFDSDWNPQVDLQAQDRCHRIGQTKPVVVYRFATVGTIDQRIVERAGAKRKLEKMVMTKGRYSGVVQPQTGGGSSKILLLELKDLLELLNSVDHERVIHSNGYVFTDEELESILDRSDMITPTYQ